MAFAETTKLRGERVLAKTLWQELGLLANGLLSNLKLETNQSKKRASLWESESYLNHLKNYDSPEHLIAYMATELQTFFDENVAYLLVKHYPNFGTKGIDNLADRDLLTIALETVKDLQKKQLDITRAQADVKAMSKILAFLEDPTIAIGDVLVFVSPRGPEFLYLGYSQKANNYINFYIKTGAGKAELVQVLNYDCNPELLAFIAYLKNKHQATPYQAPDLATSQALMTDELAIVENVLLIKQAKQNIQAMIAHSLRNKSTWQVNVDDFPLLDKNRYAKQTELLLAFFAELIKPLMESSAIQETDQQPNQQSKSLANRQLTAQKINALVKIMRQHFLKWVEGNAKNYQTNSANSLSNINLQLIRAEWLLECKQLAGQQLSADDLAKQKAINRATFLDPTTPLKALQKLRFCPPRIDVAQLNVGQNAQGIFSLRGMELRNYISQKNYTTLRLAGKDWMVPSNYLTGKGCYEQAGIAFGPCGIPLSEDPYAILQNDYLRLSGGSANHRKNNFTESRQSRGKKNNGRRKNNNPVSLTALLNGLVFGDNLYPASQFSA